MDNCKKLTKCEYCNRWMRGKDHESHYKKFHNLGPREGRGHEEILELDGETHELFIVDDLRYPVYCCKWCSISSIEINGIINHSLHYHKLSTDEVYALKRSGPTCQICWFQFDNKEQLDNHLNSKRHKKKASYVDGSGCDVCKVTLFGKLTHEDTRRHKQFTDYVKGSGCDKCSLSFETIKKYFTIRHPNYKIEPSTEILMHFHNSIYIRHRFISCLDYSKKMRGRGCEICNFEGVDEHYLSHAHKGTVTRMEKLRKSRHLHIRFF